MEIGVNGGTPVISCHAVTMKELVASSTAKTRLEQSILVGLELRTEIGRVVSQAGSIWKCISLRQHAMERRAVR